MEQQRKMMQQNNQGQVPDAQRNGDPNLSLPPNIDVSSPEELMAFFNDPKNQEAVKVFI